MALVIFLMKTAIIIPTYNERENISLLAPRIFAESIPELSIIVIDDHSTDGTVDAVRQLARQYPVTLIERPGKLGLGSAYIAGFREALRRGADYIFEMDADLSHHPSDIPRLLEATRDADLVIGSRKIPGGRIVGWNLWRRATSTGAMWLSRRLLGLQTKDVTAGFRCFRQAVLAQIPLDLIKSNGYAFQEELLYRTEQAGWRIKEIPVTFTDRKSGVSKLSTRDVGEFFVVMTKLWYTK